MARFDPLTFYRELRHRRVFRVAALYGVGAWGVIAACDVIFPQLTRWVTDPDAAMGSVFVAAIVLAPVALVLGWLYDITPGGLQRTTSFSVTAHDPDISLHPVDRWILGALSALVVAVLVATTWHIVQMVPAQLATGESAGPAIPENSIAVLPFEVCQSGAVEPLLATGIANEVLRQLAEIPNLKVTAKSLIVVARASAFAFADTDAAPQRIAATLRVHYLLSGTVCREGSAITVQAELVDGSGYLVWSHSYTEQLDASGQVTRSVAALLAEGVAGRLGAVLAVQDEDPVDRLAYERLLIGWEFLEKGDQGKARAAFEAALDRKPDYAEALYGLALLGSPDGDSKTTSTNLDTTIALAQRALAMARRELDQHPDSAYMHYMVGRIERALVKFDQSLAWRESPSHRAADWTGRLAVAERHLRRSLELNPTNSSAVLFLGYTLEEEGQDSEALSVLEHGLERDPFNMDLNSLVALRWAELGRHREAMALLERFKQLPEPPGSAFRFMLELAAKRARIDQVCEILIDVLENYPGSIDPGSMLPFVAWRFGQFLRYMGLEQESAAWIARTDGLTAIEWVRYEVVLTEDELEQHYYDQASRMTDDQILDLWSALATTMMHVLALRGEYERPIRLLERLHKDRWGTEYFREYDLRSTVLLASLYRQVGRDGDAEKLLDDARLELERRVRGGNRNLMTLDHLATTYALQGEFAAALATLELSVRAGNHIPRLPYDPVTIVSDPYAPVRADLRFRKLWAQCEAENARQAEKIRALLAERDLDTLLAPLVELAEQRRKEVQAERQKSAGR